MNIIEQFNPEWVHVVNTPTGKWVAGVREKRIIERVFRQNVFPAAHYIEASAVATGYVGEDSMLPTAYIPIGCLPLPRLRYLDDEMFRDAWCLYNIKLTSNPLSILYWKLRHKMVNWGLL